MKLAWMQDLHIFIFEGGAQLTDLAHFTEGIRRGHEIRLVTPDVDFGSLFKSDAVIISNCVSFKSELFEALKAAGKPLIFFFHDYFCRYRLYYPMLEKCRDCYLRERWLPIFNDTKLFIWLSPLHRESWLWVYPELESRDFALIPSPVSDYDFFDLVKERQGVISSNTLYSFKGRNNVIRWARDNPDEKITFIGGNEDPVVLLPPNCTVLPSHSHSEMNELLNGYKYLLHLPATPQPFERIIAEAYLAGCKIIGNELIGALSYDWFASREQVAEHCGNAPDEFWKYVEGAL